MGIFKRSTPVASRDSAWLPAGLYGGGDRLSAAQDGESHMVPLRCDARPRAGVDLFTYVIRQPRCSYDDYRAAIAARWTLAAAGWTEFCEVVISTDYGSSWFDSTDVATAIAEQVADGYGESTLRRLTGAAFANQVFNWNGEPF